MLGHNVDDGHCRVGANGFGWRLGSFVAARLRSIQTVGKSNNIDSIWFRSVVKVLWPIFIVYLAVLLPLQYAVYIGLPTPACIGNVTVCETICLSL